MKEQRLFNLIIALTFLVNGCSIFQTAENISRLKFRIRSAESFSLSNVDFSYKKSIKDFSSVEMLKLASSLINGKLILSFLLNIEAQNPNDGSGGFPRTDLTIQSFPYRLILNDKEIVNGNIEKPIIVPGKGETTIIPLHIEFNLVKNFKEKSLDDILIFVLQLNGVERGTSQIKLLAKPVIGTPIGNINYPDEIIIVEKVFN